MKKKAFLLFILIFTVLAASAFIIVRPINNKEGASSMEQAEGVFKNINVNVIFQKVEIVNTEDSVCRYVINGRNSSKIHHAIKEDTLTITYKFALFNYISDMMYGINKFTITIFAPKDAQFDTIRVKNTSGNIDIKAIKCQMISLQSTSGNISLADSNAENLKVIQTSGRLNFDTCIMGNVVINNTSGNLDFKNTKIQGLKISTTSSNTSFTGLLTGETDIRSTSGSIHLTLDSKKENYNLFIDGLSGSMMLDGQKLEKKKNKQYNQSENRQNNLRLKSLSGNVEINFIKE